MMHLKNRRLIILNKILIFVLILVSGMLVAQTNDDCLMCHGDKDLTMVRNGKTVSLFITDDAILKSVHKTVECAACHIEEDAENFQHADNVKKMPLVNCGSCHKEADMEFFQGIHGKAFSRNDQYAPDCKECHGTHDILTRTDPASRTYKMNIPYLCGNCHKEGAPVARIYNIT
jgi:hypothetical protein